MTTHSLKIFRVQGTVLDVEKNTEVDQIHTLPQEGEMCLNNSFLLFLHGGKALLDHRTLILFKNCYVGCPNIFK